MQLDAPKAIDVVKAGHTWDYNYILYTYKYMYVVFIYGI